MIYTFKFEFYFNQIKHLSIQIIFIIFLIDYHCKLVTRSPPLVVFVYSIYQKRQSINQNFVRLFSVLPIQQYNEIFLFHNYLMTFKIKIQFGTLPLFSLTYLAFMIKPISFFLFISIFRPIFSGL